MKSLACFFYLLCNAALAQDVTCSYKQEIEATDRLTIHQETNVENRTITVELVYEGLGWLGFGFSGDGSMVGNIAVIGQPGGIVTDVPNPGKFILGGYAIPSVEPLPRNQQTLIDPSITNNETHTILRFTKLLEEEGEIAISPTEENIAMYGVGREIELLSIHDYHGAFPLVLSACNNVTHDGKIRARLFNDGRVQLDNWVIHGYMMATAWGFLIPLGIGCRVLREFIPGKTTWLALHWACNGLGALLTVGAFGLAVVSCSKEDTGHFNNLHKKLGLALAILTFLQAIGGIYRPKKEKQEPEQEESVTKEHKIRKGWEIMHRVIGFSLVFLAWWNCQRGINEFSRRFGDEDEDTYTIMFWCVAGGLTLILITMHLVGKLF